MQDQTIDDLTYEWPPNLAQYETRMFGLTAQEAMAAALAFLGVVGLVPAAAGVPLALLAAALVLVSIKRLERLGGQPLPMYLLTRYLERRRAAELALPLILGGALGRVEVENWAGETLMVLEDDA